MEVDLLSAGTEFVKPSFAIQRRVLLLQPVFSFRVEDVWESSFGEVLLAKESQPIH